MGGRPKRAECDRPSAISRFSGGVTGKIMLRWNIYGVCIRRGRVKEGSNCPANIAKKLELLAEREPVGIVKMLAASSETPGGLPAVLREAEGLRDLEVLVKNLGGDLSINLLNQEGAEVLEATIGECNNGDGSFHQPGADLKTAKIHRASQAALKVAMEGGMIVLSALSKHLSLAPGDTDALLSILEARAALRAGGERVLEWRKGELDLKGLLDERTDADRREAVLDFLQILVTAQQEPAEYRGGLNAAKTQEMVQMIEDLRGEESLDAVLAGSEEIAKMWGPRGYTAKNRSDGATADLRPETIAHPAHQRTVAKGKTPSRSNVNKTAEERGSTKSTNEGKADGGEV
ncbi:unnamed protein product [Ectocarpus sp. CCAP 1310/34]|nr:unnamed protein product [Ectocarpus sp. CCAP 1310/34]